MSVEIHVKIFIKKSRAEKIRPSLVKHDTRLLDIFLCPTGGFIFDNMADASCTYLNI